MLTRRIVSTLSAAGTVVGLVCLSSCGSSKTGTGPGNSNPDGGPGPGNDASPGTDSSSGPDSPGPLPDGSQQGDSAMGGDTGSDAAGPPTNGSVLQHHNTPQRDGLYKDNAFSKSYAMGMTRDMAFDGTIVGNVLSQPLYVADISAGKDAVFVATESNNIYSLDATTGAQNWKVNIGTPVNQANDLPCGGGISTYGVSGTPVIDMSTRTIYAESFYLQGGNTVAHQVVALSIDDGTVKSGWPANGVQIDGTTTPNFPGANVEHDRGALALVNGILYIPYSGLNGDCNGPGGHPVYHGGIVGIDTTNPTTIKSWFTSAAWGGSWGTSGIPSDGTNVYLTTGNTTGAGGTWGGGEAVLRFSSGPTFSNQKADYFAPHDWSALDGADADLGSSEAILINVPGATPSQMIFAGGKGDTAYLIDQTTMGGVSAGSSTDGVAHATVSSADIKTAFASYTTSTATYVVLHADGNGSNCPSGQSGELIALKISATNPPQISTAWCADSMGSGSPMVTDDGQGHIFVWTVGATSSNKLLAFDGDLGTPVYTGGGSNEQMQGLEHWITPMAAKGKIFVGGDGKVFAFQ